MTAKVNIQDYIDLYERGLDLDQIKPLKNQTYRIFKRSKVPIRIVHRSEVCKKPMAFEKIKHFTRNNEYFYMIPVTTIKETIVGFILRGVLQSDYNTVSREFDSIEAKVPLLFGFDKSFEKFDKDGKCYPIIICEGSKDCITLKNLYPYTVAVNTSSMGLSAYVLINLSNKFVLAYDNDKAGEDGINRDKKILRSLGAQVVSLELDKNLKDISDYVESPEKLKKLKEEIKYKLHKVQSF